MDMPTILLYRAARVAVRQPNGSLLSTEGQEQQFLYITQDGLIGGTGHVATSLMQPEMTSGRTEIIRCSTHPVCNYTWKFKTNAGKFRVVFTSPWQPFAHLEWYISNEGARFMATTSFARAPGQVDVRMGPSGRTVGNATQSLLDGHGSSVTCSIDFGNITEGDRILIFQPENRTQAPVLSQAFFNGAIRRNTQDAEPLPQDAEPLPQDAEPLPQDAEPLPHRIAEVIDPEGKNLYGRPWGGLNESGNQHAASFTNSTISTADLRRHHTAVCIPFQSEIVPARESRVDQQDSDHTQVASPYADNHSSTSGSDLDISRDYPRDSSFFATDSFQALENTSNDLCIVVKPLY